MKKAIIVQGGWDGHEPEKVALRFQSYLQDSGFDAKIYDKLDVFEDSGYLKSLDLIVPVWTMGEISDEQCSNVSEAVAEGTGLAGCHGGLCDSFRNSVLWQFMTGGNWVAHPGNDSVEYEVEIRENQSELTKGLESFTVKSEQYYLHVDPAVEVLATTRFPLVRGYHSANRPVDMPVSWIKKWGLGRVYYNSLGHHDDIFDIPQASEMMRRGLIWASGGKDYAGEHNLSADEFRDDGTEGRED